MWFLILMVGLVEAKITPAGNGLYYITSDNIREIQIIKLERDYYRDLHIKKNPFKLFIGVRSDKILYGGLEYGI